MLQFSRARPRIEKLKASSRDLPLHRPRSRDHLLARDDIFLAQKVSVSNAFGRCRHRSLSRRKWRRAECFETENVCKRPQEPAARESSISLCPAAAARSGSSHLWSTAVRHETHVDALLTSAKRPSGIPRSPVALDLAERRKLPRTLARMFVRPDRVD